MTEGHDLDALNASSRSLKRLLRSHGYPANLISAVETRALRSGRRLTGVFRSNRQSRWQLIHDHPEYGTDPQYGTEADCKAILIQLLLTTLEFRNAPQIEHPEVGALCRRYLGRELQPGSYRDMLLLESLDFEQLRAEAEAPEPGRSSFHIGHIVPTMVPRHVPRNVAWRTLRSNLIQGDMTLREARIYIIRLIARYFELGEIEVT